MFEEEAVKLQHNYTGKSSTERADSATITSNLSWPAGSMPPAIPGRRGREGEREREREGRKEGRTGGRKKGREGRGDLRRQERIKETEGGESQRARERKLKGGIRPRAGGGERVGGTDGKRETMEGEKVTALWI